MDAIRHRWIERETFARLLTEMTRVRQFAGKPEILAGRHRHLGFVALIRKGETFAVLLNASEPDRCFAGLEPGRSAATALAPRPIREPDHRSKPTSLAFLALGTVVAVTWAFGLGWLAYKAAGAAVALGGAALSFGQSWIAACGTSAAG